MKWWVENHYIEPVRRIIKKDAEKWVRNYPCDPGYPNSSKNDNLKKLNIKKMDTQSKLFSALLELQGLVQIYNAYCHTKKDHYVNSKKIERYKNDIKKKAIFLGLKDNLQKIMDNKIPYIKDLRGNPLYIEFLRTNNTDIEHVYFKNTKKFLHSKHHGTYNYY